MDTTKIPLGTLLSNAGYINEEQINVALGVQKINGKVLGEILIDLDFVTSSEVAETIALQNKLDFVNLDTLTPSNEALSKIPTRIASSKNILPLYIQDGILFLASDGVVDLVLSDNLRRESGLPIKFVIADKSKIKKMIHIFYHQLEEPVETKILNMSKHIVEGREIDISIFLNSIINCAIKDHATDIHITPKQNIGITFIAYRIDGVLTPYFSIPFKIHSQLVAKIKMLCNIDMSEQRLPQDGNCQYSFYDEAFELRISTLPTNEGENIVVRLLDKNSSLSSLKKLGFSDEAAAKVEYYFSKPYGIVLVTGPTGSGKTTTLYSSLRKINPLQKNILTIEDPIEYHFSFIKQTQIHQKSGYDFSTGLKAFMRQDPDVMLIGEIRDKETAELAIRASITGHLVLSTLHTNDSIGSIPRLDDLGVPSYLIGSALLAVIGQRLARKLCDNCKQEVNVSAEDLKNKNIPPEIISKYFNSKIYKSCGCENCKNIGYSGRVAIVEIFEINEKIETLITNKDSTLDILRLAKESGFKNMREDGYIKVLQGLTTFEEIDRVVN